MQLGKCLPVLALGSGGQNEIYLWYRLLSSQNLAENNILPELTLLFCWPTWIRKCLKQTIIQTAQNHYFHHQSENG